MVKRFSFRPYAYLTFALLILLASWEGNKANAAVIEQTIPQESIRLRILAHSDAPRDQWIKREVRDAVTARMNEWVQGPQGPKNIEEARAMVQNRLFELDRLIEEVLRLNGFTYDHTVELGIVPFPTKMYGNKVYPAGNYEALRVTLGDGEGQNWWCVLFPPLCFVDVVSGEAVAKDRADEAKDKQSSIALSEADSEAGAAGAENAENGSGDAEETEYRFFLWDLITDAVDFIKGLFA